MKIVPNFHFLNKFLFLIFLISFAFLNRYVVHPRNVFSRNISKAQGVLGRLEFAAFSKSYSPELRRLQTNGLDVGVQCDYRLEKRRLSHELCSKFFCYLSLYSFVFFLGRSKCVLHRTGRNIQGGEKRFVVSPIQRSGDCTLSREIPIFLDCDVIVNTDKAVSRHHANITFGKCSEPDKLGLSTPNYMLTIKDLSRLGTFITRGDDSSPIPVQSYPTKETVIENGDLVTFGTNKTTFRYEIRSSNLQ